MASPRTAVRSALPWWAAGGDETCPHCLQRYHYEVEVRCAACDGPLCPSCAVSVTAEVVELHCPDCHCADGEEA